MINVSSFYCGLIFIFVMERNDIIIISKKENAMATKKPVKKERI